MLRSKIQCSQNMAAFTHVLYVDRSDQILIDGLPEFTVVYTTSSGVH